MPNKEFPVLPLGQTTPVSLLEANVQSFSNGVTCALWFVAALIFLRFYRKSHDRLFMFFAASFAILSFNRIAFLLSSAPDENRTHLYVVRLIAFTVILVGIIDKNRSHRGPVAPPAPPSSRQG
jgi:hypothetical protein